MTKFECDNCKSENTCSQDGYPDGWISMSMNNYVNKTPEGTLRKLNNYYDLHFCCKECLVSFFTENKQK